MNSLSSRVHSENPAHSGTRTPGQRTARSFRLSPQGPRTERVSQLQDTKGQAGRAWKVFSPSGVTRPSSAERRKPIQVPSAAASSLFQRPPAGNTSPGSKKGFKLGCSPRRPHSSPGHPQTPVIFIPLPSFPPPNKIPN